MRNPFKRKTTYQDFRPGMIILAINPNKENAKAKILFKVKNTDCFNDSVTSVWIRDIGYRLRKNKSKTRKYIHSPVHESITVHILDPASYFKGLRLKIIK